MAGIVIDGDGFIPGTRVAGMIPWFEQGGHVGALADIVSLEPSEGVDAFDPGSVAAPLLRAVRDGGRYVAAAGSPEESERGITLGRVSVEPNARQLTELFAQVANGSLVTRVAAVLPAAEFAEGFRRTAAGRERGKIVFTFPI